MTRVRLYYLGRKKIYDMIRNVIFEDFVELKFIEELREINMNPIIVDNAFKKEVNTKYIVDSSMDITQIIILLSKILSEALECSDITIGIDPGDEVSGIAILHCNYPTIHAKLPTLKIVNIIQHLSRIDEINAKVCIGVKSSRKFNDRTISTLLSLSNNVPTYVIDEASTKYRRSIYNRRHGRGKITRDELDAVVYALSIDESIRVRL